MGWGSDSEGFGFTDVGGNEGTAPGATGGGYSGGMAGNEGTVDPYGWGENGETPGGWYSPPGGSPYTTSQGVAWSFARIRDEIDKMLTGGQRGAGGNIAGWEMPRSPGRTSWAVPAFFANPPQGYGKLSPLALSYLSQLFPGIRENPEIYPQYQYGKEARPEWYPTREYMGGEGTVPQRTALIQPLVPSAQIAGELERMGLMPLFQQYLQLMGAGDLMGAAKSYWPTQQGPAQAANWRVPVQR